MAVKWLKTGEESKKLAKEAEAQAAKKREEFGKLWRFWLEPGEKDCSITFVDGVLDAQGFLTPPRFYEHSLYLQGKYGNTFVCPEKTDTASASTPEGKCPICAGGNNPDLMSLFTVVDHRSHTSAKGILFKDTRKLFAAKPQTFEILNKLAIKRGGLVGVRFDVSRSKEKAPRTGDLFDFTSKTDPETLRKQFVRTYKDKDNKDVTVCDFTVADYDQEIVYRTADELRKMGFGNDIAGQQIVLPDAKPEAVAGGEYDQHL